MDKKLVPIVVRPLGATPSTAACGIEPLEARIAPAYVAALAGGAATLTGDAGNDTLTFSAVDGVLHHNRFTAGDPGFESDTDFDSATPGVQTLAADAASTVSIDLGSGSDAIVFGSDGHAALLKAAFTVNNPAADDSIEVKDSASGSAQTMTIGAGILTGTGINIATVPSGATFGSLTIRTGTANDSIVAAGVLAPSILIECGPGNDSVNLGSFPTPASINGGPGNDTLNGSGGVDVIRGGTGNDVISGGRADDLLFGENGVDRFIWNPGDGSDTIDGGLGNDLLTFNGANIAEKINLFALAGHFRLTRDIGTVTMDNLSVEKLELNMLGGADTITQTDLSTTSLHSMRLNLAASGGSGDAATDTVNVIGTERDNDLRAINTGTSLRVHGVGATIDIVGHEFNDQLVLDGGLGFDNVFASAAVSASITTTLIGEKASNAIAPLAFAAATNVDAGKTPVSIAAGNLLGTTTIASNDLVVVDPKSNAIDLIPDGGNGVLLPAVQLATGGKTPRAVALTDFDGDGLLDIAVTNSGSGTVAILLNHGDGTFGAPTLFPAGKTPGVVRVADITRDGKFDLVMTTGGNSITILPGNGDGTFGSPIKLAAGGVAPADLAIADFSGDGRLDIAVANSGSNTVSLVRANADDTFATPLTVKVGVKPTSLVTADFDGDGNPDLAVTHGISRFVSVLLNQSPVSTPFSSQLKLVHAGRHGPTSITAGDLDGDGRADLVVANTASGSVSVFGNLGGGTFRPALTIDLDNTPPRKVSSVALFDVNGDGSLDIVTANAASGDVTVLTQIVS